MTEERLHERVVQIAEQMGLDAADLEDRKAYLGLTADDEAILTEAHASLVAARHRLIDAFYAHFLQFGATHALLNSSGSLEQLKRKQADYFDRLTAGEYDLDYALNRLRVGIVHQHVGLTPRWYLGAWSRYLTGLLPQAWSIDGFDESRRLRLVQALIKIVFLDLGLALETYVHADRERIVALKEYAESIVADIPLGLLVLNADLRVVSANPALEMLLQVDAGALDGRLLERVLAVPDLIGRARAALADRETSPAAIEFHIEVGEPRHLQASIAVLRQVEDQIAEDSHSVPRLLLIVEDLTEARRLQHEHSVSEARAQAIMESVADGIITTDDDGVIESFNGAAERMFGWSQREAVGRNINELIPVQCARGPSRNIPARGLARECAVRRRAGAPFPVETATSEMHIDGERRIVYVVRDISERKQVEDELRRSKDSLADAQRIAHLGNWEWDIRANTLRWSDEIYRIFGLDRDRFGATYDAFLGSVHPEDREIVRSAVDAALHRRTAYDIEHRIVRPDGVVRVVQEVGEVAFDADGAPVRMVGTVQDITGRKEAEAQMIRLSRALEQTADNVLITDRGGLIEYCNPAFERSSGFTREEVVGQTPRIIKSADHGEGFYQNLWETILAGKVYRNLFINTRRDGTIYYEEKTITPITDEHGTITHFVSTGKDVTERMLVQKRLDYLAHYDALTGLPNRALFMERLKSALARAAERNRRVAVLYLDLDRFKIVNETLGHVTGDALLLTVSKRLADCLDTDDTVARLGGDEFGILLEDIDKPETARHLAEDILAALGRSFPFDGEELFLTTSIGISLSPDDGSDPVSLLKNADTAMYRAKERGKNTYQSYTEDMGARASERLSLESRLRKAVERGEFVLHYQPQFDAVRDRIVGVEALIRWRQPDDTLAGPTEFIPLLEETGLILAVGEWVLHEACTQARKWCEAGFEDLRVAVNLSARQIRAPELVPRVEAILERSLGGARCSLELEITESLLLDHHDDTRTTLRALDELGLRLCLDDFGTGYSSLAYLNRFPIRALKIDRSFVSQATVDRDAAAIATTIIAMARSLKLDVIAEGVETEEQRGFLLAHDCRNMQGYLFGRPQPAEELTRLLSWHSHRR